MSYVLTICYPGAKTPATAQFAARLAIRLDCPLHLVHGYSVPVVIGDYPVPVILPDDLRQTATSQLDGTAAALRQTFPGLRIEPRLSYGIPADVLAEAIEEQRPLIVVLGNDAADPDEAWLGTDTSSLMAELDVPVLALDSRNIPSEISHVALAIDSNHLSTGEPLAGLEELQQALGFSLSVLTVVKGDHRDEPPGALASQLQSAGALFMQIPADERGIGTQLAEAARSAGADCLAVLKHDRGFWDALFHRSQTESLLKDSGLPVLAFHQQQKS